VVVGTGPLDVGVVVESGATLLGGAVVSVGAAGA